MERKSKLILTLQNIIIIQKRLKNTDIKILLVLILIIFTKKIKETKIVIIQKRLENSGI